MKTFGTDTTSVPVVTVRVYIPSATFDAIASCAVKLVVLDTAIFETVIPAPMLTCVVPWAKWVNWPVTVIGTVAPCWPVVGPKERILGVPGRIVNPFARLATSDPVVTVTVTGPGVAVGEI